MVWIDPGNSWYMWAAQSDQCVGSFTARGAQIRAPPPLAREETTSVM